MTTSVCDALVCDLQTSITDALLTLLTLSIIYRKDQVFDEFALDLLRRTQKCGIDPILKYFIYLVLKKDSQEKKDLDRLADELENTRLKRRQLEQEGRGATDDDASILKKREESLNALKEAESTLVESRNVIQDKLLYDLLSAVLGIANDRDHKRLLVELEKSRGAKNEKARYPPFVRLCNAVLAKLQSLAVEPFKSSNEELNIKFQVNDPSRIQFQYHGTAEVVVRCPDFIVSSYNALVRYSNTTSPRYDAKPPIALEWPIVLLSGEVKTRVRVTTKDFKSRGKLAGIMKHTFKVELEPAHEETHESLDDLDPSDGGGMDPGEEEVDDEEVSPSDVPDARHSRATSSLKRNRDTEQSGSDQDRPQAKKNRPIPTPSSSTSPSHSSVSQPTEEVHVQRVGKEAVAGRVQCASYAQEMLSYSVGVRHAINLLLTDRILWVWYYDRQGTIQSTGISVFKDFPRFVALLFLFQRFSLEDWGIIPALNPEAVDGHGVSNANTSTSKLGKKRQTKEGPDTKEEPDAIPLTLKLQGEDGPCLENYKDFSAFWKERGDTAAFELTEVEIPHVKDFLSHHPHCLAGRATAVVPAVGYGADRASKVDMVCKISHPEVQRRHEGTTMAIIYKIAAEDQSRPETQAKKAETGYEWNMFDHLPKFYFYGDVEGTSTRLIRTLVDCDTSGHRTMRIIGMKKLTKITTLQPWNFVKAWFEAVVCHAFLWKNYVEHGDPSVGNLMFDPGTGSGVLTDFDLSLLQWEPRVLETERTGTVPFMALDLLTADYWVHGLLTRYYYHELESFIWMIPYVFLQYDEGKRWPNSVIDGWRTSDYKVCIKEKTDFLYGKLNRFWSKVQKGFQPFWVLAAMSLTALRDAITARDTRSIADMFVKWNPDDDDLFVPQNPTTASAATSKADSEDLWKRFMDKMAGAFGYDHLKKFNSESQALLAWLEFYKPSFDPPSESQAEALLQQYKTDRL